MRRDELRVDAPAGGRSHELVTPGGRRRQCPERPCWPQWRSLESLPPRSPQATRSPPSTRLPLGPDRPGRLLSALIAWTPCGPPKELQCARIRVPLDWDRPERAHDQLAVIRHLASKPTQRIGTMFVNPGGPGDSGVGLVRGDSGPTRCLGRGPLRRRQLGSPGHERAAHRWTASPAPRRGRGSGRAPHPHHAQPVARLLSARPSSWPAAAAEVSGDLLDHISTGDTARDLDALRQARRGPPAHLRRPVLRTDDRPDLRQPVPRPGAGDDARRHRRSGPVLEGGRDEGRQRVDRQRRGLRPVPRPL